MGLRVVGVVLALIGAVIGLVAFRNYSLAKFVGWQQLKNSISRNEKTLHSSLITSGLQSQVRHPLYTGIFLFIWGYWLLAPTLANLVFNVITTAYIPVGVYFEEQKLVKQFGTAYDTYRKSVPMLFPKL